MFLFKKKLKLVTHDGSFHTDDVFACATLCLLLEKKGEKFEIIRTRDLEVIKTGDYVFDVGGEYNPETNRFDHHQIGGAGKHDDGIEGIEYASFGLVWKKFGIELCGNEKVVRLIEERLVSPVDAGDNGFDLVENKYEVSPYFIQHFFSSMRPSWTEENLSDDEMFLKCVSVAKMILTREIIQAKGKVSAEESLITIYKNSKDKRIIVLDKNYPFEYVLNKYLEPLFVIYPRKSDGFWGVKAVREDPKTFNNRKDFPKSWAGLRDHELQKITGVSDSIFCHRGLFLAVAKSKEGAIKLAQLALQTL